MKDRIFSANDRLLFTNDRIRLGSVTFSHNRILYMIIFLPPIMITIPLKREFMNYRQCYMLPFYRYFTAKKINRRMLKIGRTSNDELITSTLGQILTGRLEPKTSKSNSICLKLF